MRDFTKGAYEAYFGLKLGDQDKSLSPHKVCKKCSVTLRFLTQGKARSMRFLVPMAWREANNHHEDFIFARWILPDGISERRLILS